MGRSLCVNYDDDDNDDCLRSIRIQEETEGKSMMVRRDQDERGRC